MINRKWLKKELIFNIVRHSFEPIIILPHGSQIFEAGWPHYIIFGVLGLWFERKPLDMLFFLIDFPKKTKEIVASFKEIKIYNANIAINKPWVVKVLNEQANMLDVSRLGDNLLIKRQKIYFDFLFWLLVIFLSKFKKSCFAIIIMG